MRLKEAFLLFTDLLMGGTDAFQRRWKSIQSDPHTGPSAFSRYVRMHPEARWHLWAVLGMIGVNYLILVHVPTWLTYWQESQTPPAAQVVSWEPEIWETDGIAPFENWETNDQQLAAGSSSLRDLNYGQPTVDVDPVPINLHQIRRRVQVPHEMLPEHGTVRVRVNVFVDARGEYVDHRIAKHGFPELAKAVESQVSSLSFLPALRNGRPVPYWVEVSFVFDL